MIYELTQYCFDGATGRLQFKKYWRFSALPFRLKEVGTVTEGKTKKHTLKKNTQERQEFEDDLLQLLAKITQQVEPTAAQFNFVRSNYKTAKSVDYDALAAKVKDLTRDSIFWKMNPNRFSEEEWRRMVVRLLLLKL